jgi:hypothetical protein
VHKWQAEQHKARQILQTLSMVCHTLTWLTQSWAACAGTVVGNMLRISTMWHFMWKSLLRCTMTLRPKLIVLWLSVLKNLSQFS